MTTPKTIRIDNEEYVRASDIGGPAPIGNKFIVVLDRGWIFAGNLDRDDDDTCWVLTNAVNIRKWATGGFGLLTRNPHEAGAVLDKSQDVVFERFIHKVPVADDWGKGL